MLNTVTTTEEWDCSLGQGPSCVISRVLWQRGKGQILIPINNDIYVSKKKKIVQFFFLWEWIWRLGRAKALFFGHKWLHLALNICYWYQFSVPPTCLAFMTFNTLLENWTKCTHHTMHIHTFLHNSAVCIFVVMHNKVLKKKNKNHNYSSLISSGINNFYFKNISNDNYHHVHVYICIYLRTLSSELQLYQQH